MSQDQCLRERIAKRSDPDLQRSAIRHDAGDPQPGRILGKIDRLARRRKQRKIGLRTVEDEVERFWFELGVARHKRHFAVDLPNEQEVNLPAVALCQQI
jgi:hypothetical protein